MALRLGIAEGDIRRRGKVTTPRAERVKLPFFMHCTVQPSATFAELDRFIRKETGKNGHLSQFHLMGREDPVAADDEFGDEFSEPATTRVVDRVRAAADRDLVTWEFDFGSPTELTIVALSEHPASSMAATVALSVGSALANAAPPAAPAPTAGQIGFDDVYPQLSSAALNDGAFVVGKGDHPFCVAYAFNCGGNLSDLESEPQDGINGALEALEEGCYDVYHSLRDLDIDPSSLPSDAERSSYDFAALHPRIAKFVSLRGRKRFVHVGTGRGGPFAKAMTGDNVNGKATVVWQSRPSAERYGHSVATVLREMEANMPA